METEQVVLESEALLVSGDVCMGRVRVRVRVAAGPVLFEWVSMPE